ncbi:glucosyl-dolichyl phosphate glucuronosyltransferase [Halocalculus aciditolerans]|uniref:Glycosyl transferase family A n=1 Tax=Halocalculus aciditolerans TaxID=1383812 RepID=A0A830F6J6_9EURY|nr:glucosyl-dolichyl phosphate glucuronosyltransferase [Halocalculus aciditolerans]GGL59478.1 glycosyl transferase family A [Halocalculus aciditolerans]
MRVSVVLCTYTLDMYDHFREAADSVLAQSHGDVELVVVVDGYEDVYDTVNEDYGGIENVQVHCNDENQGLLISRNRGAAYATGDVVAFIDDDAVADEDWLVGLVDAYEHADALAAGGKLLPQWVAGKPDFLPEEFYWLVGAQHAGFADGPGEVRNTFGSNISFRRDIFEDLGGFDPEIGGRKGEKNLQGGETELCARLRREYDRGVYYVPSAEVEHKIFDYRTDFRWLCDRAFWQGYSKRAMEELLPDSGGEETDFLAFLLLTATPQRLKALLTGPSLPKAKQLVTLYVFTALVGFGYLYGVATR